MFTQLKHCDKNDSKHATSALLRDDSTLTEKHLDKYKCLAEQINQSECWREEEVENLDYENMRTQQPQLVQKHKRAKVTNGVQVIMVDGRNHPRKGISPQGALPGNKEASEMNSVINRLKDFSPAKLN